MVNFSKLAPIRGAFIFLLVSACATPETNPANLSLTEENDKAALVVKLSGKNVNYFGVNSLSIIKYDAKSAANNPDRPPVIGLSKVIDLKYKLNTEGYTVAEISPGTYFLAYGSLTKKWAGCFNKNTIRFDVEPNKITYLGEIDLDEFYREVKKAIDAYEGDKLERFDYGSIFSTGEPNGPASFKNNLHYTPSFKNEGQQSHKDVTTFLTKNGAKVDVPVVTANLNPMSFRIGRNGCSKPII